MHPKKLDPTLQTLRDAAQGLFYLSETDAPLKPFVWKTEDMDPGDTDPETVLRKKQGIPPETPIQTLSVADFLKSQMFEYEGQPDQEKESVRRFRQLQQVILQQLREPLAFRIGTEPEIPAYILGRTPDGDWAGFSTHLVET